MSNGIANWSFSTLTKYETCPFQVKLSKIDKLPEPERPADNPLERGNREHKILEDYVSGLGGLAASTARALSKFKPILEHAQQLYAQQLATTEQDWWFDSDWFDISQLDVDKRSRDRSNIWLWAKLDLNVTDTTNRHVITCDYKTGKSGYKAVEHVQQIQLYAAIAALRFEWADKITGELWYIDEGWIRSVEYTRDQALAYVGRFQQRADRLMTEKLWRPNPNTHNCRYCPYSPRGTGACPVGV